MNTKNILVYFYEIFQGDQNKIYKALKEKRQVNKEEMENYLRVCDINVNDYITVMEMNREQYESLGRLFICGKRKEINLETF